MLDEVALAGIEKVQACVAPEAMRSCILWRKAPAAVWFGLTDVVDGVEDEEAPTDPLLLLDIDMTTTIIMITTIPMTQYNVFLFIDLK